MQPTEIQTSLEELEERIDRVRALYEQYFCGIEKIEPQIPRKDVDRRIYVLRKEQIRNTAMRFKFQTLVQRYNTMSQHWGRVLREIENGTFKRDLARAAARFGIDSALTAVGKKRAERLAKGLEAQLDREARRKQAQKQPDDYEVVDEADLESVDDFDDDAPTPPPQRAPAAPQSQPFGVVYPTAGDGFDDDGPSTDISEVPPAAARGHGQRAHAPAPVDPYGRHLQGAPTPYAPPVASQPAPPAQAAGADAQKKTGGGLRLGGGPSRRANMDALKRIASLVEPDDPAPRKPLLSSPIDVDLDPDPAPAQARSAQQAAPAAQPAQPQRKPLLSSPIDVDLGPAVVEPAPISTPAPAPASPPRGAATASPAKEASSRGLGLKPPPRAAGEATASRPQPKPAAAEGGRADISDGRLREIYAQYVNTRRERNESTAGITFEKLADSLRSQADKLRSKHAAKKVDYEVVVKDGKTLIKPIVR